MIMLQGFVQEADQMGPNSFSSSTNQRLYSDMMTKRAWLTRSQTQRKPLCYKPLSSQVIKYNYTTNF